MKSIYARLTFTEELLGTASGDPEIHKAFIASKAPDAQTLEEEVASIGVDPTVEKKSTIFSRNPETGEINIWAYQVKGQFKAACGSLRTIEKPSKSSKAKGGSDDDDGEKKKKNPAYACGSVTNYLKKIDTLIHVYPKRIMLHDPSGENITKGGNCQRPLRAKTAQGDRVALANSETVPEGTYCDIQIVIFDDSHEEMIRECLDFGAFYGLGQWRNSGKGRFIWQEMTEDGQLIETKNRFMPKVLEG